MASSNSYSWGSEKVSLDTYIKKVFQLIDIPVRSLQEMDGDMMLSDYRDLIESQWRMRNLIEALEEKKEKNVKGK